MHQFPTGPIRGPTGKSIGAVGLLLAGIVLVDLIAISTDSPSLIAACLGLFGVTLLFQKYIPAT